MNKIQHILYNRLKSGDPKLCALFEQYVQNMGHSPREAKMIVEQILEPVDGLLLESLATMSKYDGEYL